MPNFYNLFEYSRYLEYEKNYFPFFWQWFFLLAIWFYILNFLQEKDYTNGPYIG